jgi:hypothetical protein
MGRFNAKEAERLVAEQEDGRYGKDPDKRYTTSYIPRKPGTCPWCGSPVDKGATYHPKCLATKQRIDKEKEARNGGN